MNDTNVPIIDIGPPASTMASAWLPKAAIASSIVLGA